MSLEPGESAVLELMWTPMSILSHAGTVLVVHNGTGDSLSIRLTGTRTAPVPPEPEPIPETPEGMVWVQGWVIWSATALPDMSFRFNGRVVDSFFMGIHEITWDEWRAVRSWSLSRGYDLSSRGRGCAGDHPVQTVNWYDAVKWCNARSEMEGLTPVYSHNGTIFRSGEPEHTTIIMDLAANGYRLPTEPEWEFAARGGIYRRSFLYAGSFDVDEVAWYNLNSFSSACSSKTWPVGLKLPNGLGLYDMSGNVWEWTWMAPDLAHENPRMRGGSSGSSSSNVTVTANWLVPPDDRFGGLGFRVARSFIP